MRFDELIWNFGDQPGSEAAAQHRSTDEFVLITRLADGRFKTEGLGIGDHDHDSLSGAELVALLRDFDVDPAWNVEDFPHRAPEPVPQAWTAAPLQHLEGELPLMFDFGYWDENGEHHLCGADALPWQRKNLTSEEAKELYRRHAFPPQSRKEDPGLADYRWDAIHGAGVAAKQR